MKRALDLVGAGLGLVLLWPLFVVIAVAILVEDGRPVLFVQQRIGRGGRPFGMLKFRTMVDGASNGRQITVQGDSRITRVGRVLRSAKLDELPQLLNVLRGQMRLVGPRPEVARYVALYTPSQRAVLQLVPGITDPASLRYYDEGAELARAPDPERLYVDVIMPEKIRLNLQYAAQATAWSDLRVVLATLRRAFVPRGVDSLIGSTLRT